MMCGNCGLRFGTEMGYKTCDNCLANAKKMVASGRGIPAIVEKWARKLKELEEGKR